MYYYKNQMRSDLKVFLAISFALIVIGLMFIYSASSVFALEKHGASAYFVKKQLFGLVLGFAGLILCALMPLDFIKKLVPFGFFSSLGLTALTLLPRLSQQIHGSRRWLSISGFSFQPSELLKISLILYVAYLLTKKDYNRSSFNSYLQLLIILGLTAGVLLKQPDFGLTVTLCVTVFILLFIAQFNTRYLLITALLSLPSVAILIFYKPYRLKRILTFLNPWEDPQGAGFQIIQSLIAIGSGHWWGIGVSNSKQKFFYLPMQHTDFIFSIIAEETGFVGSFILITLFLMLIYFGMKIAWKLNDNFATYSTLGFMILITLQSIINLCVATGLFPTKGIGLPFVSYGNSSLICTMVMIGLVINFVKEARVK